jgi:hypothetical protein
MPDGGLIRKGAAWLKFVLPKEEVSPGCGKPTGYTPEATT